MIKREKQIITQIYKPVVHRGLDLRCVDDKYRLQPVIAPEDVVVTRLSTVRGEDGYGNNYIIYRGKLTGYVFKSVHCRPVNIEEGKEYPEDQILGWPEIGGNSKALHEHFEVWKSDESEPIDPVLYFIERNIEYAMK